LLLLLHRMARRLTDVPHRPLLAPWYRLVGDGDRLVLEHAQTAVVLEGAAVRTLLPALLPLLDGTRTREELYDRVGSRAAEAVDHALELLAAHGLLAEGPDAPPGVRATAHAVAAAYGLSPAVAAERLRDASVAVLGSGPAAAEVARLLHAAAVGHVRRGSWRRVAPVALTVVAPAVDELERLEAWNENALARGAAWLPLLPYDGRFAAVGPLMLPGESCCYACVLTRRAANLEYGQHLDDVDATSLAVRADAALDALVVAVAAHVALRWVAGNDATLPGVMYAVEPRPRLSIGEHPVLRVPRCRACSPAAGRASRAPWHEAA